jgi:hypothetical protein
MRAPITSVEANRPPEAPQQPVPPLGAQERRESERLITDWEAETRRLGRALARMTLDTSAMTGPKWAHRFIIAVNPVVEDSSFLFYGAKLAFLMELAERPDHSALMIAQLPAQYVPVFTRGCIASTLSGLPVRMQGTAEGQDGRRELYRAAFIRISLETNRQQHFALGAFYCRLADRT